MWKLSNRHLVFAFPFSKQFEFLQQCEFGIACTVSACASTDAPELFPSLAKVFLCIIGRHYGVPVLCTVVAACDCNYFLLVHWSVTVNITTGL